MKTIPKLLYFVAEDWYFWSHRRLLAQAAKAEGYDVYVLTRVTEHGEKIESLGFKLIPLHMERHGKNIFKEIRLLTKIIACYRNVRPDLVHHVSMKPVLYGKLAAIITGVAACVNTFPGLGYVFHSEKTRDRFLVVFIVSALKCLFRFGNNKVIVQNKDDAGFLNRSNICRKEDLVIIRGSGVDMDEYKKGSERNSEPVVLFASRLLLQKGIYDYVAAAKIVRKTKPDLRFVIVGKPDKSNPNSVPSEELETWQKEQHIEWWGYKEDMPEVLRQVEIIVLPTFYGEGIPKILIEAAASGKPIIATDVAGCREIVRNSLNGYLVPVHSPEIIAQRIIELIDSPELCVDMGEKGRELAEQGFSIGKVNSETLSVYSLLVNNAA